MSEDGLSGAPVLGCIADDFTGATDLGNVLVRSGMRTVQMIGVPTGPPPSQVDALVVALKSRSAQPGDAVSQSLAALNWLRRAGCRQFYFKYCSTFDSTDEGNIGPVIDALMDALAIDFTIACPAFPDNKRILFNGYLFVDGLLINESGMQHHPLTPMTDPNMVRVLQRQTGRRVGLIDHRTVRRGAAAITAHFADMKHKKVQIAIVDAVSNEDLSHIGAACACLPLVTAASGLALGLVQNFVHLTEERKNVANAVPLIGGLQAVIAGSCSTATQDQVAAMINAGCPAFQVDPMSLAEANDVAEAALGWAERRLANGPVLVYATAASDKVKAVQARLGIRRASQLVEEALAAVAKGLARLGVRQLIAAGGETAGAVVKALGVTALRIGPQIEPGVPWTTSLDAHPIALALKSGNFGAPDFFLKAWDKLQ